MKPTSFFLTIFLLFVPNLLCAQDGGTRDADASSKTLLKVMSFNIWVGGGKSEEQTLRIIKESGADLIGVQEATKNGANAVERFAKELGWHSYASSASQTILSRFPIVAVSRNKTGVKIQIDDRRYVWMFNVHLAYCPYEPYQLNGIEYCGAGLLATAEEAVASAWKTRKEQVEETLADIDDVRKEGFSIFLTGDFNEPSCLDWTERAAQAGQCKMPVVWPCTKAFQEKGGMKDAYRTRYPDEVARPGHTWTTCPAKKEVHDRIDFVFFQGDAVCLEDIRILGDQSSLSDVGYDAYPSDHRAVLGTFSIRK